MRRYKNQKFKLFLVLAILLVLGIGIGYSVLTEKLDVDSSVAINEMKWDIGFSSSEDNGGSILSESSISEDGKTLTVICDFGSNTKQNTCSAKATITNNSIFDVGLASDPTIVYEDDYIHTLTFKWNNHPTYENKTVLKDNFIAKGESEEVILTIKSKFINKDNLPDEKIVIPVKISLNFMEWQQDTLPTKSDLAILKKADNLYNNIKSSSYLTYTKKITIENEINIPSDATQSWDIGENPGKVMAYVIPNETDSTYYDLYIQSDGQLYANEDMSNWFSGFRVTDSIDGLHLLDTSSVVNMERMFTNTGIDSESFILNVSNFDTSNVTSMNRMFVNVGANTQNFVLDVSGFDTSNVTDMYYMFQGVAYDSKIIHLDVSNFDTSKVTNMSEMFNGVGRSNPNFTLDVSNFNTSNVTDMSSMFINVGSISTVLDLNVGGFDTSKVTDMTHMFTNAGQKSPAFTLNVSNWDTSNVTKMKNMFTNTGIESKVLTLDVSNWDTSNVTDMSYLFQSVGKKSPLFSLDVSNWDTRKVTNMSGLFYEAGYSNPNFNLDVSNFVTDNVTDMSYMFFNSGYNSKFMTLDVSNFDTSKVTNMKHMFFCTGYKSTLFNFDLSNFDTSLVTDMSFMINGSGFESTKLNTSITIRNSNTTLYSNMLNALAMKPGSQVIINYTSETSDLVDAMLATKSPNSNVVKGVLVN